MLPTEILDILLHSVANSHMTLVNLTHTNRELWHLSKRPACGKTSTTA